MSSTTKALWTSNYHIYIFTISSFIWNLNSQAGQVVTFRICIWTERRHRKIWGWDKTWTESIFRHGLQLSPKIVMDNRANPVACNMQCKIWIWIHSTSVYTSFTVQMMYQSSFFLMTSVWGVGFCIFSVVLLITLSNIKKTGSCFLCANWTVFSYAENVSFLYKGNQSIMLHWNVDFTCNKMQLINLKQYEVLVKESFELSEKLNSIESQILCFDLQESLRKS